METTHHYLQRTFATSHGDCGSTVRMPQCARSQPHRAVAAAPCGYSERMQRPGCAASACSAPGAASACSAYPGAPRAHAVRRERMQRPAGCAASACSAGAPRAHAGLRVPRAHAAPMHRERMQRPASACSALRAPRAHAASRVRHGILTACGFAQRWLCRDGTTAHELRVLRRGLLVRPVYMRGSC